MFIEILDHPYGIFIIGESGSGSGTESGSYSLFNLISHQPDIDKMYLYVKDPYESKYKLLTNNRESRGVKYLNDSKAFMKYSNDMDDIYKNIEEYNSNKRGKVLVVFDDKIAHMFSNKKLNSAVRVTELFITGRKLNISLVFITQSYFAAPKNIRLNSMHYFIMKIPNTREFHQTAFNQSSDSGFKEFMNLYKKCTAKPYSFLVIDAALASYNTSAFRKNLLERT